jgi:hypothetical protein
MKELNAMKPALSNTGFATLIEEKKGTKVAPVLN